MNNNLMNYNINELRQLYYDCNDDFKKFFIKKAIEYKIYQIKNNKLKQLNELKNNDNKQNDLKQNETNKENKDTLDDLMNFTDDNLNDSDNNSDNDQQEDDQQEDNHMENIEDKYAKQIKFDSANNKMLERLNVESNFRMKDRRSIKKEFVSPFADDNPYNDQFKNDHYINSVNKLKK